MLREAALLLDEPVAQPDVGEGAADHHFVIASARAIGVEVADLYALFLEPAARRAVPLDRSCGGDVIGGDRVAENGEDSRALDRLNRLGLGVHALEEARLADVGG